MRKKIWLIISLILVLFIAGCTSDPSEQNKEEKEQTADPADPADTESDKPKQTQEPKETTEILSGLTVHYIDVGQADSTLFQFSEDGEDYTILIDSGDFTGDEVVDYLREQNVKDIDIAVGTHPDADHIGQLDKVLNAFQVGEVWLSGNQSTSNTFQRVLEAIDATEAGYEEPRMGDHYEVGPLELEVLYPKEVTGKTNEESISLKLTYGDIRFVFTGDASKENELEMINSGADLEADILQLGHHGSSTSTSKEFLEAVKPKIAIYSAGENNTYGHPHEEVVNLIKSNGIDLYGTDVHGTIIVKTDGKEYDISTKKNGTVTPAGDSNDEIPTEIPKKSAQEKDKSAKVPDTSAKGCININNASFEQVESIIHIGPERAQDLIDLRPYNSVEELSRIDGIGPARIDDIIEEGKACVGG